MDNIQNEEIETSQNNQEELDTSQNKQEDLDSNQEEDDTSKNESTDNVDELNKKVKELEEKNKRLQARAQKGEVKSKENEAKFYAAQKGLEKQGVQQVPTDPVDTIRLFNSLKDYSPEEVDIIAKHSKMLGKDLVETAKDEDVQLLIEAKREKIKNEKANPVPGTRQDTSDKTFEDWKVEDVQKLSQNPTKENIQKMSEYIKWMRTRK